MRPNTLWLLLLALVPLVRGAGQAPMVDRFGSTMEYSTMVDSFPGERHDSKAEKAKLHNTIRRLNEVVKSMQKDNEIYQPDRRFPSNLKPYPPATVKVLLHQLLTNKRKRNKGKDDNDSNDNEEEGEEGKPIDRAVISKAAKAISREPWPYDEPTSEQDDQTIAAAAMSPTDRLIQSSLSPFELPESPSDAQTMETYANQQQINNNNNNNNAAAPTLLEMTSAAAVPAVPAVGAKNKRKRADPSFNPLSTSAEQITFQRADLLLNAWEASQYNKDRIAMIQENARLQNDPINRLLMAANLLHSKKKLDVLKTVPRVPKHRVSVPDVALLDLTRQTAPTPSSSSGAGFDSQLAASSSVFDDADLMLSSKPVQDFLLKQSHK